MTNATSTILSNATVTPDELRHILRAGKSATYAAIKSGKVPHFFFGGSIHIPSAWVRTQLGIEA